MKKFKTKISLFIATLACLGAGAFTLTSDTSAKAAEEHQYGKLLTMSEGASICLDGNYDNGAPYRGIRWTTTIKRDARWGDETTADAQFGAIVAPTDKLGGEELTHELTTTTVLDIGFFEEGYFFGNEDEGLDIAKNDATFYSVVDYASLSNNLSAAYALKLTARAYVKVAGVYYYANISNVDTSRSARSVALAAELSGYIDETYRDKNSEKYDEDKAQTAVSYYRNGASDAEQYVPDAEHDVNSAVVNLSSSKKSVVINDFEVEGTIQDVFVGAESVPYTYNALTNTLTLTNVAEASAGEYYVTALTDSENENIYTRPLIFATKILKTASDLEMFHAKGVAKEGDKANTLHKNGEYYYDGYYVLGNNIDASNYSHGSKNYDGTFNTANWDAYTAYAGKTIGLRGTFNGMGYTIDGMTQGSVREGLFGMVNGGTVKNLAITNLKAGNSGDMHAFAKYLINATIENVYIQTNAYDSADATNNPGFRLKSSSALAYAAYDNTKIKNVVIDYQTARDNKPANPFISGLTFVESDDTTSYTYENVYCVSGNQIRAQKSDGNTQTFKHPLSLLPYTAATDTAEAVNGYAVIGSNESATIGGYTVTSAPGAYRYNTLADLYAAQKNNDAYKALANTGLWTVAEDGTLSWVEDRAPINDDSESGTKILIIGNSHSQDTFWALPQVAAAEGVTDITFGICIKGSTTMQTHNSIINDGSAVYEYYISEPGGDGSYTRKTGQTMDYVLGAQDWDYVFLQLGPWDPVEPNKNFYKTERDAVVAYISQHTSAEIGYSVSWLSPYDNNTDDADYLNIYNASVALAGGNNSPYARYQAICDNVKANFFNGDGTPNAMVLAVGTPVYYVAEEIDEIPPAQLYRDELHLSREFGGVLSAYAFYTQFMHNLGLLNEIDSMISMETYKRWNGTGNNVSATLELTEADRTNIAEAVNYALNSPWTLPAPEEAPEVPEVPETPETPETPTTNSPAVSTEDLSQYKNILIIGNSHSEDTFKLLPDVFKAECENYTEYKFGILYQGGSSLTDHADNLETGKTYAYHKSDASYVGLTEQPTKVTLAQAMKDGWDIVFFQNGPLDLAEAGRNMNEGPRTDLENYMRNNYPNVKIGYCVSWVAPYCDAGQDGTHYVAEQVATKPENAEICYQVSDYANYSAPNYRNFTELTDELTWKIDYMNPITQHNKHVNVIRKCIVGDPDKGIERNSVYTACIGIGTAILYANQVDDNPIPAGTYSAYVTETSGLKKYGKNTLYRDNKHLSDNARALAAYTFYTQYMGINELTKIKMTTIPASAREQTTSNDSGDLAISANWQGMIMRATRYAKANTWNYVE